MRELIEKLRKDELTVEEKGRLIAFYWDEAIIIAKFFSRRATSLYEDLKSEALLGLLLAIDRAPKILVDNNFQTYLRSIIKGRLKNYIQKNKQHTSLEYIDIVVENLCPELKERLEYVLKTEEESEIIDLRLQGYNDTDIAVMLDKSCSYVNNIRRRIGQRWQSWDQL